MQIISPKAVAEQSQAQARQDTIAASKDYASIIHSKEVAVSIQIRQSVFVFLFVFVFSAVFGLWLDVNSNVLVGIRGVESMLLLSFLIGWLAGSIYYGFSLYRWHNIITRLIIQLENKYGVDINKDNKIGSGVTNLVFTIRGKDGQTKVVRTEIPTESLAATANMATAYYRGHDVSQAAMERAYNIKRKLWEKINAAFLDSNLIEKSGEQRNDPYVFREWDDQAVEVMSQIMDGNYEVTKSVWGD